MRILADDRDIWFSPRSLLEGGQQQIHDINIEWFALHVHVLFGRTPQSMTAKQHEELLNPRGGLWAAAYGAQLLVHTTSLRDTLAAGPVLLDNNGAVIVPCPYTQM